jgi:spore coat protein CotH
MTGGPFPTTGGSAGTSTGGAGGTDGMPVQPIEDAGVPIDESVELYDPELLPRFDITLPEASLASLRADSETYVRGELRYGNEVVSEIGVRIKGEGSLRTLDEKAAFKLKMDKFVPDQAFRGLRRMTFNNMVEDPSFLAERLAYEVFRAADLPAPRCNSALIYVNDEFFGVYANVEAEDKTFLRRWFADDDGNLYEEGQVDFEPGAESAFDLETNETANDRSDLRAMIEQLDSASTASFATDMSGVLDMPHFLRFTAAEALVNQWDMYGYTVFYPNNFRLYHDPTSSTFVFLPWGMDMSMKPFRDSGKPHIAIYELARRGDWAQQPVTAGLIFRRCLESSECRPLYSAAVRELVDIYEAAELEAKAERYYEQIAPHVRMDPRSEYSEERFEAGYEALLSTIRERPDAVRAELEP